MDGLKSALFKAIEQGYLSKRALTGQNVARKESILKFETMHSENYVLLTLKLILLHLVRTSCCTHHLCKRLNLKVAQ
jgi:hypothetical protein